MHRDMKIGLSLGVLLVGIVGALFFRREPEMRELPPQLQDAKGLDVLIAEKQHGPYITAPEDFADPLPAQPARSRSQAAKPAQDIYQVPDFLTQEDQAAQQKLLAERSATAPDPIQPETPRGGVPSPVNNPVPVHNKDWQTAAPASRPTAAADRLAARPDSEPAASRGREHVVKSGDTLSTLASHYLGSSSRFPEIYEANRDVLRSPDDLREGTTIIIPEPRPLVASQPRTRMASQGADKPVSRLTSHGNASAPGDADDDALTLPPTPRPRNRPAAEATTAGTAGPDRSDSEAADPEGSAAKGRFRPVRRSPFAAGRVSRAESFPVDTDEPAPQPTKKPSTRLPQIDVQGSADLLDSENEAFRPLSSGGTETPSGRGARSYKVQRGDTLEGISLKFYGKRSMVGDILDANGNTLTTPEGLREGMELLLP